MLNEILNFKSALREKCQELDIDIDLFFQKIDETYRSLGNSLSPADSHWKNYLHASLISLFLEIRGYDLLNWNEYISKREAISRIFGFTRSAEDKILELFVLHSINHVFDFGENVFQIRALRANSNSNPKLLTDDSNNPSLLSREENKKLLDNLKVAMKVRGMPKKEVWGDNDVIVTLRFNSQIQQFCIVSCKVSLRERVYQSVFWSMHSRLEGIGKHVFVTTDKGNKGNSEIGNRALDNDAKKSRDVLESTMDRVYVLRNEMEVNRSLVIKDFAWLRKDLLIWANEVTGSYGS